MRGLPRLILLLLLMSCSRKMDTLNDSSSSDGKSIGAKAMLDGKTWMTENLDIDIPGSYCQQDDTLNCNRYGRLYTWEAASKGCELSGGGWRLPTNEEWQAMAKGYGGVREDSEDEGASAYKKLTEGGDAEFNAQLGGNREAASDYKRLGAHGFYWTATEYDSAEAWFYNFGKESAILNRHSGDKRRAASVRCVKDLKN